MKILETPALLQDDTTLYGAVPLALDPAHKEAHLTAIARISAEAAFDAPFDMQLVEHDDIQKAEFSFFDARAALFCPAQAGRRGRPQHAALNSPFTSLLIGPVHACLAVMRTYLSWAHALPLEPPHAPEFDASSARKKNNAIKNMAAAKFSSTARAASAKTAAKAMSPPRAGSPRVTLWKPFELPKTWARASSALVELPCYAGAALQKELGLFFKAPIAVRALPVFSSEHHSEYTAWLYAFYALTAARLAGRTVLCHYQSVADQCALWHADEMERAVPLQWQSLMEETRSAQRHVEKNIKTSAPARRAASKNSDKEASKDLGNQALNDGGEQSGANAQDSDCAAAVRKSSQYYEKLFMYESSRHARKAIGYCYARQPMLCEVSARAADYKLTLRRTGEDLIITTPFLPSARAQYALKSIAHRELGASFYRIYIEAHEPAKSARSGGPVSVHSSYAISGNLLLHAARKLRAAGSKDKTVSVSMPASAYRSHAEVACVMEYRLGAYSSRVHLHKAHLCINAGYVAQEKLFFGDMERIVKGAVRTLFGVSSTLARNFMLDTAPRGESPEILISLMEGGECTASVRDLVKFCVLRASADAIARYLKKERAHQPQDNAAAPTEPRGENLHYSFPSRSAIQSVRSYGASLKFSAKFSGEFPSAFPFALPSEQAEKQ